MLIEKCKEKEIKKVNKKPLKVYWAPGVYNSEEDLSFFYSKPESLFNNARKFRKKENSQPGILACPAFTDLYKRVAVFTSPITCKYEFDYTDKNKMLRPMTKAELPLIRNSREDMFDYGPIFFLSLGPLLFAEEPVVMRFTPPYFHKPQYTQDGTVMPGEFNIGEWFRPLSFELQMWNHKGEIKFVEGEPLMYLEFFTDRPIELIRFDHTEVIHKYVKTMLKVSTAFGKSPIAKKYERFRNVGMREKILKEIKNNLVGNESVMLEN